MPKQENEWLRHPIVATVVGGLILAAIIGIVKPLRGLAIEAMTWSWGALHHPVPAWIVVALIVIIVFLAGAVWVWSQRVVELELEKLNTTPKRPGRHEPELVAVWEDGNSRWGTVRRDGVEKTYVAVSAHISMRNAVTNYSFIQASVNGSAYITIERLYVRMGEANLSNILLIVNPSIGVTGVPLEATITFQDAFGEQFMLPPHTLQHSTYPPPYR